MFYPDNDQLILDVIPPPELHLLLGCINTLYSKIFELYPDTATKWAQLCNIKRSHTNGGNFSFEGNACKALLSNVDTLQRLCEIKPKGLAGCLALVDTFKKFKKVVDDCVSLKLRTEFEQHIFEFEESYKSLKISITPKIDTIFKHIPDICSQHSADLGFFRTSNRIRTL